MDPGRQCGDGEGEVLGVRPPGVGLLTLRVTLGYFLSLLEMISNMRCGEVT